MISDIRLLFFLFMLFPRACARLTVLRPVISKFLFLLLWEHRWQSLAVWGFCSPLHKKGRMITKDVNS